MPHQRAVFQKSIFHVFKSYCIHIAVHSFLAMWKKTLNYIEGSDIKCRKKPGYCKLAMTAVLAWQQVLFSFSWTSPVKDLKYKPRSSCELMESAIWKSLFYTQLTWSFPSQIFHPMNSQSYNHPHIQFAFQHCFDTDVAIALTLCSSGFHGADTRIPLMVKQLKSNQINCKKESVLFSNNSLVIIV